MIRGLLWLLVGTSWGYWLVAWFAARSFFRRPAPSSNFTPPVSILKPVKGIDAEAYENFLSFCRQDYPEFELLFGVVSAADPAVFLVKRLQREFPQRAVRLIVAPRVGANPKSSILVELTRQANYKHLVISDSDIRVTPDYLRRVMAPFEDRRVGLVTCPYRSTAPAGSAACLESLYLDLSFLPSAIVAHTLAGVPLGLGATLAVDRDALEQMGGYRRIVDCLSDDYLVAAGIARLGRKVLLSDCVVTNVLGRDRLGEQWNREVRWARGIRVLRPWNYAGLVLTFCTPLAIVLAVFSGPAAALGAIAVSLGLRWLFALRMLDYLDQRPSRRNLPWLPLRDLMTAAVWCWGAWGDHVVWREAVYKLLPGNRLCPAPAVSPPGRILAGAIRRLDAFLRRRQGIYEFTGSDQCLFRLSLARAPEEVQLSDGSRIARGEPILELHFWNEHIPPIPAEGPGVAWAGEFWRRLVYSFEELARHLESDDRLQEIRAVRADLPLASRNGRRLLERVQRYLGAEFIAPQRSRGFRFRLRAWGERLYLWGLVWAFNPHGLKGFRLARDRRQLWISRSVLLRRFGTPARHRSRRRRGPWRQWWAVDRGQWIAGSGSGAVDCARK